MNKFVCLLLFIYAFSFAQNDSIQQPVISFVSTEKMKIAYRGLPNPISIAVPGKKFTAEAPGLTKVSEGKYMLHPEPGVKTIINVTYVDDAGITKIEKHQIRILNMHGLIPALNGNQVCPACNLRFTIEALNNAEVSAQIPDLLYENLKFEVKGFSVRIPKKEPIIVEGNKFNAEIFSNLKSVKKGSQVIIYDIKTNLPYSSKMAPIVFEIYKPKPIKFKPSKTERDSLRMQRKEKRVLK